MIELRVENRRRMKPGAGPRMALACALVASAFACPPAVAQLPEVPGVDPVPLPVEPAQRLPEQLPQPLEDAVQGSPLGPVVEQA